MSVSLYCGNCHDYIGHHNPEVPRNYVQAANLRRCFNNICSQCEAINGAFEARLHLRHVWNKAMKAHELVIDACKRTINAVNPNYDTRSIKYSIGIGGYTVMHPARKHSDVLRSFSAQDARCLLSLGSRILTAPLQEVRDYRVSANFAYWIALMRHIECTKMNRAAVSRIVREGVEQVRRSWQGWSNEGLQPNTRAMPQAENERPTKRQKTKGQGNHRKYMSQLGEYFSRNLTRREAQQNNVNPQGMAYTPIPNTPRR